MTVKDLISQIEYLYGKQPHMYLKRLINDGLLDMSAEVQSYKANATEDLKQDKRWYPLSDTMIEVNRVEILNSNNKYELIPYVQNHDQLLEGDKD